MNTDWYTTTPGKPSETLMAPRGLQVRTSKTSRGAATPAKTISTSQLEALKTQKAWDIAMGPGKQIPMNAFMSYMSGSSLQIIPITMTLMLFSNTFNALLQTTTLFKGLDTKNNTNDILMCKLSYVVLNLVIVGIGLWKLDTMGLIPTKTGDWLSWEQATVWSKYTS